MKKCQQTIANAANRYTQGNRYSPSSHRKAASGLGGQEYIAGTRIGAPTSGTAVRDDLSICLSRIIDGGCRALVGGVLAHLKSSLTAGILRVSLSPAPDQGEYIALPENDRN